MVNDIREKISLPGEKRLVSNPSQLRSSSSQFRTPLRSKAESDDLEVLVFANIKMSLLIHKYLVTAWLKVSFG